MRSPRRVLATHLEAALVAYMNAQGMAQPLPVTLERPANPDHGDLALNLAMQLAGRLRRKPRDVAEEIAALLPSGGPIAALEVAGPGFINIRLAAPWLMEQLVGVVGAGADWGRADFGAGEKVQVEFVSTNPTGPLLFSHGRGAVVGDSTARLLSFTGHQVAREFYVNDKGRQVRTFGESLLAAREGRPAPEDGYAGAYIQELADAIPADLLDADPDASRVRVGTWAVQHYLEEFRIDLGVLGIHFDNWFSETSLYGDWEHQTIAELDAKGLVTRHDGATWLRFPDGKEDVLYKTNGEGTYFLGDVLYHRDKLVRRGFDRAIDVWGADHQNQVRRLTDMMELLGVNPERFKVILIQLVRMKGDAGFIKISKRAGNLVLLRELIDGLGADAVRYHYLLRGADSMMDFDVDLARRKGNENPVFYAQYAHARLCSLRAVAAEAGLAADPTGLARLTAPGELDLTRELLEFPEVVEMAARELAPHMLPHYAQRLSEKVHSFYHAGNQDAGLRVVVEDRELAGARLFLCEAARHTIANALGLIGVSAPERM